MFDDALWYNVHQVSERWDIRSADTVTEVKRDVIDEVADELIEKYITQKLTQLWSEEVVELILNKLLDEQVYIKIAFTHLSLH